MTATRMALEDVGWTDKSQNGLEQTDKTPVIPEHMHNGLKWKALIEEKRQKVLADRNKHIPSKSSFKIRADPNENDVKIIDRSYFKNHSRQNQLQLKN
jgi:predicted metallopeptidase